MAARLTAAARVARADRTRVGLALVAGTLLGLSSACASQGPAAAVPPVPVVSSGSRQEPADTRTSDSAVAAPTARAPIFRHAEVVIRPPSTPAGPVAGGQNAASAADATATVPLRVIVTLPDWIVGDIMSPLNFPVVVVGPANDSTVVRTDETGIANFTLKPGRYRVTSLRADSVARKKGYEWDLTVDVSPGMRAIRLTEENAVRRSR